MEQFILRTDKNDYLQKKYLDLIVSFCSDENLSFHF